MWRTDELTALDGELFLAGQRVQPGVYRQVESSREVLIDTEDTLPASLDGRVACYTRVNAWGRHRGGGTRSTGENRP